MHRSQLLYAASILLIVVCYTNSLSNAFHFDDSHVIENNAYIRSLGNVPRFFVDAHTFSSLPSNATYRPLVSLTLAVDYALGRGLGPRQFHITQILLMVILFLLIAELFRSLVDNLTAIVAATWFAIHTVNTETMNLISARSELLAAMGVVGSLLLFIRSPFARKTQLHVLPMVGGILAKAFAAIYAPLLLIHQWLYSGRGIKRAAIVSLPAFVVAAIALTFVSRMNAPEWVAGGERRYVQTQAWITVHYLRLFFLPVGLSADTDLPLISDWYDTRIIVGLIVIACLIFAAFRFARHDSTRAIAFGLFWFVVTLAPSALFPLAEVANEHRVFLPYIGLALAATSGARLLLQRFNFRFAAAIAAALIIGGNAIGTVVRNRTWRTEETLWLDVTQKSPANGRALMNYGLTQMQKGALRRANDYFERAALLTPNYSTLEINRGIVSSALGDNVEAEQHFTRALQLHDDGQSRYYYARWLAEHGRAPEAVLHLKQAIRFSPAAMNPRRLLMDLYFAAGDARLQQIAAETHAIDPALSPPMTTVEPFQKGLAATQAGHHLDAAVAYRSALALTPRSTDAWNNLGWELAALGFRRQAAEAYEMTLRIDPAYERARNNLALLNHVE